MVTLLLFGVKFHRELEGMSTAEIARRSRYATDYGGPDINNGRQLGKYVRPI